MCKIKMYWYKYFKLTDNILTFASKTTFDDSLVGLLF